MPARHRPFHDKRIRDAREFRRPFFANQAGSAAGRDDWKQFRPRRAVEVVRQIKRQPRARENEVNAFFNGGFNQRGIIRGGNHDIDAERAIREAAGASNFPPQCLRVGVFRI